MTPGHPPPELGAETIEVEPLRAAASAPPLNRQIYERVRAAILDGRLPPGARLPSWNSLASQLGVSRGTVKAAYDWLAGEGYIVGRGPAGTVVSPELRRITSATPPGAEGTRGSLRQDAGTETPFGGRWGVPPRPFQPGVPGLDVFPRKLWSRLVARHAARLGPSDMSYPDPAGHPALREAVAGYLAVARGIACSPDEVFVTAGFTGALDLITRALLREGDQVWCEDPGYPNAREGLRLAGAAIIPVRVDGDGLNVAQGVARAPGARLALVTPSCQAPLGARLPLPRRLALLEWAARAGSWVVEDDYYSEFRLQGPPLPALKSLDGGARRVLYVGSFSKVLLPGLRLGYVVVPAAEAPRFARIAAYLTPSASLGAQRAVADFVAQGHLGRHIRRMRALYAARRAALVAALQSACGARLSINVQDTGMHLLAHLPRGMDDVALTWHTAAEAGLGPVPLSPWAVEAEFGPGLMLGFANTPVEAVEAQARLLAEVLDRHFA